MKILVISPKNKTVFNFRGDLIKDMIRSGNEVFVTGPNKDYTDDILALGVKEFYEVPFVKDNTSISGDIRYMQALRKVIRGLKPDLVFSYNIKPVVYGSMAAKLEHTPSIYAMVAGLGRVYSDNNGVKAKMLRLVTKVLYKNAFKACKKVLFQNNDDIKELVDAGYLPIEKTAVVNGSGVNTERFVKSELPEKPIFLMVGRIIREKGVFEFCEAARILKKDHPEARCILLGGFDTSIGAIKPEDIKPYIEDGSIELHEEVKDPVEHYKNCSVFVLPSYYREGLPRTILEAMSCGRAVITTDWIGCREPITDGENGFLVPIKDGTAVAQKMKLLAENRDLLCKMAEKSYAICKEKYDVNVVNAEMKRIIGY